MVLYRHYTPTLLTIQDRNICSRKKARSFLNTCKKMKRSKPSKKVKIISSQIISRLDMAKSAHASKDMVEYINENLEVERALGA